MNSSDDKSSTPRTDALEFVFLEKHTGLQVVLASEYAKLERELAEEIKRADENYLRACRAEERVRCAQSAGGASVAQAVTALCLILQELTRKGQHEEAKLLGDVIDALRLPQSHVERRFHVCEDHKNADWNQPELDADACVLCRLFYLEAQESLLEEWQQRALKAEAAIEEIQRPLDAQMARLNATVTRLNEENERLRSAKSATGDTK